MTDAEYEHLIAETSRLLEVSSQTSTAHAKACHNYCESKKKLDYEQTRRKIIADYIKEQQELADLEAQYQLEQAQAGETP